LGLLIQTPFAIEDFQISGGPKWLNADRYRYDIDAKSEGNPGLAEVRRILQSLLAERFKLVARRETQTIPVFALTIAKGGHRLSPPADSSCQPPPVGSCGGIRIVGGGTSMQGVNVSAQQIARVLTALTGRRVLDRTDLHRVFNFRMEWMPDQTRLGEPNSVDAPLSEPGAASVRTALQAQPGLKLIAEREAVDVLSILQAGKPTGNCQRAGEERRIEVDWLQVPVMKTMPTNEHVEVRNGVYYVAGTRIGLDVVYYSLQRGRSAEGIFEAFPSIGSLAKARGAVTFIQDHPNEIHEYLKEQDRRYEEFTSQHPLPPELIERFERGKRELLEKHN
jgi:uncharacterized protein (TIGR03435 family)